MGLYDNIELEDDVILPEFENDPQEVEWQTKTLGQPFMHTYKITNGGRLLEKNISKRDMTEEEITKRANEEGYDSWEEWEEADTFGPLDSWKQVTDEIWWTDTNQHGSFEMHAITYEGDESTYWSYEARFTKGELDEIILLRKS